MSLDHGGHLTHGAKVNFSGKLFRAAQYGIRPDSGEIDYEQVQRLAQQHRPKMIVAGFSAYSRVIDWARFAVIARSVNAYFVVDMGSSPISEVEPADVLALCKGIAATHPKTGEYIRLTLSRIFSYAIRNLRAKHNPAREIQGAIVVPSAEHHKPLSAKQIPGFIEALDRYPGRIPTKLAAKLLLLTMVRKRELINATWNEVDLKEGIWTIPPERMKRREPHMVPLSKQALAAFKELKPMA